MIPALQSWAAASKATAEIAATASTLRLQVWKYAAMLTEFAPRAKSNPPFGRNGRNYVRSSRLLQALLYKSCGIFFKEKEVVRWLVWPGGPNTRHHLLTNVSVLPADFLRHVNRVAGASQQAE